jgi:arylsulfatase A-like enzyme
MTSSTEVRSRGLASATLAALIFWGLVVSDHLLFGPLPIGPATLGVAGLAAGGALALLLASAPLLAFAHDRLVAWVSAHSSLIGRGALSLFVCLAAFTVGCFVVYFASPRIPASSGNVTASLATLPVAAALGLFAFRKARDVVFSARTAAALASSYAALGGGVSGWIYPYNTSYEWAHSVALGVFSLTALAIGVALVAGWPRSQASGKWLTGVAFVVLSGLTLELVLECRDHYARWDLALRGGRAARAIARNLRSLVPPRPLTLSPLAERAKPAGAADFTPPRRVSKELAKAMSAIKPTGVLLLTVDAARADYGATRRPLPTFERLANEGVVFRAHYTAAGSTRPAIRTLFQGRFPWMGRKREGPNLFRIFHDHGFRTLIVLPNEYPLQGNEWLRDGVDQLVTESRPAIPRGPVADQTTDALLRGLERVGTAPFFAWAHYLDPHEPYDAEGRNDRERYVGELARVDKEIGRLLSTLETRGLLARTLVVLTADHGEEFFEHGGEHHGLAAYEESIHVPLIFRVPGGGLRGSVEVPTSGFDLGPTLLDIAGVRPDEPFGSFGDHLFEAAPGRTVVAVNQGLRMVTAPATSFAAVRGRFKLVYAPFYESAELYDLHSDPHEMQNLVDEYPRVAAALARDLTKALRKSGLKPN